MESFLRQDYTDAELIILNDQEGVKYKFEHPRVRVINSDTRYPTLGDKCNAWMDMVPDDTLVAPWPDDDLQLPWALSTILKYMQEGWDHLEFNGYWFMNGMRVTFKRGSNAGVHPFTKDAWKVAGQDAQINSGSDQVFRERLKRLGKGTFHQQRLEKDEAYFIYRWGTGYYHLSGLGKKPDSWNIIQRQSDRKVPPGIYEITPRWEKDYLAMTKQERLCKVFPSLRVEDEPTWISWNAFRQVSHELNFEERRYISDQLYRLYPTQRRFHAKPFKEMFDHLPENPRVIELGCYDGALAKSMLSNGIGMWTGYDFPAPISNGILKDERYKPIKLGKWFHEVEKLPEADAFVSSHTLEHLTPDQCLRTLEKIAHIPYVLIELPLECMSDRQIPWKNYQGTHVLPWGLGEFKKVMTGYGYKQFYENKPTGSLGWEKA